MYLGSNQKKITAPHLLEMKKNGDKISVLTAYDALMAQLIDDSGCDVILVGDSAGMPGQGEPRTW